MSEDDIYYRAEAFDRLDTLSNRYYSSPNLHWILLLANNLTTEFDLEPGMLLRIPSFMNIVRYFELLREKYGKN